MPRRGGKAANRRTRQRKAQRQPARPQSPPAARTTATPVPPVGTPDAREATSLDPPRRPAAPPPSAVGLRSSLGQSARAEYHYVERDLRNIAVLSAVMFLLLLVAWAVANALNLTGGTA